MMLTSEDRVHLARVQAFGIVIEPAGGTGPRRWFTVMTDTGKLLGSGYVLTPDDGSPQTVHFTTVRVLFAGPVARTEYVFGHRGPPARTRWGIIGDFWATLLEEGLVAA